MRSRIRGEIYVSVLSQQRVALVCSQGNRRVPLLRLGDGRAWSGIRVSSGRQNSVKSLCRFCRWVSLMSHQTLSGVYLRFSSRLVV